MADDKIVRKTHPCKKICSHCGKEFSCKRYREAKAKFCSFQCYWAHEREKTKNVCAHCGKEYSVELHHKNRTNFCSKKCTSHHNKANTLDRLALVAEYLIYDPVTGHLTWIKSPNPSVSLGSIVSRRNNDGYLVFRLKHMHFSAHVVGWALHHGKWPETPLDHENGTTDDNRIANLRAVTNGQNLCNQMPRSKSGYKGVYAVGDGYYRASIHIDGRNRNLGRFKSAEEANEARIKAEKQHGIFEFCESGRKRVAVVT